MKLWQLLHLETGWAACLATWATRPRRLGARCWDVRFIWGGSCHGPEPQHLKSCEASVECLYGYTMLYNVIRVFLMQSGGIGRKWIKYSTLLYHKSVGSYGVFPCASGPKEKELPEQVWMFRVFWGRKKWKKFGFQSIIPSFQSRTSCHSASLRWRFWGQWLGCIPRRDLVHPHPGVERFYVCTYGYMYVSVYYACR